MITKPVLLAVDDELTLLSAIDRDLRREYGADFRIVGAASGSEALATLKKLKLRNEPVALLLVAQRMPQMTGVEFLEQAMDLFPDAKRVLLTAYADTDIAIFAMNQVKLDYYLHKPWDPPEEHLYPVLKDLLDDWQVAYRPSFEGLRFIGYRWAPNTHRMRDLLARNQARVQWLDLETSEEAHRLLAALGSGILAMAVLLSNLVARRPTVEDFHAISELVATCDIAEHGIVDSSTRDLASGFRNYSFQLESDAWVIVNARKQFVGFACVWHRDHEEFSAFICVHPQYCKRGIGTLLLRMAEQHARELMPQASPGARVSLRGVVCANSARARSLFEREGYLSSREFWRVTLELVESSESSAGDVRKFTLDLDVDSGQLIGTTPLSDREGIYSVRQFVTYEKELRPADEKLNGSDDRAEMLFGV